MTIAEHRLPGTAAADPHTFGSDTSRRTLVRALGHRFSSPELLEQALTHRSAGWPNNERLEFLGDALINMIVAEALFRRWPKADEGALTRARSQLVREGSLADLARVFSLGEEMTLGAGELKSGGWRRDSILADALEALVGAIFLDAGFEACRDAVIRWFGKVLDALPEALRTDKDPKTRLQEWLQARALPRPDYQLLATRGEEHERIFDVRCMVPHAAVATEGTAASRRQAEQIAAEAALRLLEEFRDDR